MPLTVLVGPPGAGKSTVGPLVAGMTGRPFVDADDVATPWYASVGWSADRLRARSQEVGFERAHGEWEVALAAAVVGLVDEHPDAVLALGAGHSHVTSPSLFPQVRAALATAGSVVLLRPSADPAVSLEVLRERCRTSKGHDWRLDGVDWLERWLADGLDEQLATRVVLTDGLSPQEAARRAAATGQAP